MTTLDARAHRAAAAIHTSVAEFTPAVTLGGITRRAAWQRSLNFAGAVAVVVVAVLVGAWLRVATDEPDVADTMVPQPPPTTVVTEEVAPVVEVDDPEVPTIPIPVTPPESDPVPVPPVVTGPGGGEVEETEPVDTEPPFISITSPEDGARFEEKTIRFEGTTEPGAAVTAGRYAADVDAAGHWSIVLVLSPGGNGASFTATDAAGNEATAQTTVYYDPPPPPEKPPPEEPPPSTFSAHATYGSCAFDPPYDIYYGTAAPEATITITSEYGGGTTTVDAEGSWELQVFFPDAPPEKVFLVTVKDGMGGSKKFEFVSLVGV